MNDLPDFNQDAVVQEIFYGGRRGLLDVEVMVRDIDGASADRRRPAGLRVVAFEGGAVLMDCIAGGVFTSRTVM